VQAHLLRRSGSGRNVTCPARQYSVNGERRSFALVRPITDAASTDRVREVILEAFAEYEARVEIGSLVGSRSIRRRPGSLHGLARGVTSRTLTLPGPQPSLSRVRLPRIHRRVTSNMLAVSISRHNRVPFFPS